MNVSVFDIKGTKHADMSLADAVFAVPTKSSVIHQVYTAIEANAREPWAHTKTKDEVRGGGKKPWKQKGTGRARHGSTRSPIWKGGGVTFGPRNLRNYAQKINKKMRQLAVRMVLSQKAGSESFFVVDGMESLIKTKDVAMMMRALPIEKGTTLVLTGETDQFGLVFRNMPRIDVQRAIDVNLVDLLHHKYILASKHAVETLESRLG